MIIDIHAHYIPQLLFERFDAERVKFPSVTLKRDDKVKRMQFPGGELTRPIMPKLSDLDDRRAWMDKNGIDHQLVGGWLDSFGYELPATEGLAWSRYINACMQESLAGETRFTPLATVPLQDGKMAAQVLAEAMEAGFGGLMIGTLPKGQGGNLDDPALDPFWQAASDLKAGVFLHPMFLCGEPRLADYDLVNAIGRVADTSIAVARLLHSGHLLKFPGVKLVISHGGAALPYVLGRLARNFTIAQGKYADPRKGFEALYFDSIVFDLDAFEFLAGKAGPGKVMLGSDMPFPIGDLEPQKLIHAARVSDAEKKAMLGGTARGIFRVRADCWCRD
ncbi:MAG: amidohydrolase [Betaproteobacteria bacterium]|nr:amidohydrolase [Betaproteobacteria bacterium]